MDFRAPTGIENDALRRFDKSIIYHGREILLPLSHSIVLSGILSAIDRRLAGPRAIIAFFVAGYNPPSAVLPGVVAVFFRFSIR